MKVLMLILTMLFVLGCTQPEPDPVPEAPVGDSQ